VTKPTKGKKKMTHQLEASLSSVLLQLLIDPDAGDSRFSAVLRLLLNEAMKIERTTALADHPFERTEERTLMGSSQRHWSLGWGL